MIFLAGYSAYPIYGPTIYVISCVAGLPLDAPSPHLVTETEPSSIINYLHRSDAFRLGSDWADFVKNVADPGYVIYIVC